MLIVSTASNGLLIDLDKNQEVDIDEYMNIGHIKEIIHDQDDSVFYILANKYDEKFGFFLIRIKDRWTGKFNLQKKDNPSFEFIISYKNKLEIGDASVAVLRDRVQGYKELVLSYKTIYINTYNVHVMDISPQNKGQPTLYRHESFQLWESESMGLLLHRRNDFLKLS